MKLKVIALGSQPWERKIFRWGLSFLVGREVLFDTFGREDVFAENLSRFKINIRRIKHIFISHQHWDHTRGLFYLAQNYPGVNFKVYILKNFTQSFKRQLTKYKNLKIIEIKKPAKIKNNIYTTGEISGSIPEQSLVIEKRKGLIIITGCSHPGIVKIVDWVKKMFSKDVLFLIGGFHLKDSQEKEIVEVVKQLKRRDILKVAPTHCTGEIAEKYFQEFWDKNCIRLKEGMEIEI
jgi:7,8-dihydropterin-6-yl-methyl-4-(beta-D-ribofuranosyl)aminobenzene 5'-phosphate synthase